MTLRTKYKEIMDKIKVSEELEQRLESNLQQLSIEEEAFSHSKTSLRKYLQIGTMVACFTVCILGLHLKLSKIDTPPLEENYSITSVKTVEELSEKMKFQLKVPNVSPEFKVVECNDLFESVAEIVYSDGVEELNYRIGINNGQDISGVYTVYSDIKNSIIGHTEYTLKGESGEYSLITWVEDEYSFALQSSKPLSSDELLQIATSVELYNKN